MKHDICIKGRSIWAILMAAIVLAMSLCAPLCTLADSAEATAQVLPQDAGEPTEAPTATPTPTATITPTEVPTEAPTGTPTPTPTGNSTSGSATQAPTAPANWKLQIGRMNALSAQAGGTARIAIPIQYLIYNNEIDAETNVSSGGGVLYAPASGIGEDDLTPSMFSQEITGRLKLLKVTLQRVDDSPLTLSKSLTRTIVGTEGGNKWGLADGDIYNLGFALFDNIPVDYVSAGSYNLNFRIQYADVYGNEGTLDDYIVPITITAAAPTATPTPDPNATPTPVPTEEPVETPTPEGGEVSIGNYEVPSAKPGGAIQFAIPVKYINGTAYVVSNLDDNNARVPYSADNGPDSYNQRLCDYVQSLSLELEQSQLTGGLPLSVDEIGDIQYIVKSSTNYGYAVFNGLTVKKSASNGTYAVNFTARWIDAAGNAQSSPITANFVVKGASSGGGGGGGGGGGTTTLPQAKLYVESVTTDPEDVKAGDEFDLILTLRNTNEKQYVQNLKVTVAAEEDALLPVLGSNATYIDKIAAMGTYQLTMRVKSQMTITDKPVKLDITMEYEDTKMAAQSATQMVVVNVKQVDRLRIDDPVPADNYSATAGETYTYNVQVANEGRSTLYNVAVTARASDSNLMLPTPYFIGNMDGGTAKTAEIDLTPSVEGDYAVSLDVTYENAQGEQFTETRDVSFNAQPAEQVDYGAGTEGEGTVEVPQQTGVTAMQVLSMLPWWLYAAIGLLFVLLVLSLGLSARSRRRKALEDDEVE